MRSTSLPCLVTGDEGAGGSFFTVELTRSMFLDGSKILFFSAFPMAKQQFFDETKEFKDKIGKLYTFEEVDQKKTALFIMENNPQLFNDTVKILPDVQERILVVKNIEIVDVSVLETALKFEKIILSGNIDLCSLKEKILQKKIETKIFFSQSKNIPINLPKLEKYQAYFENTSKRGIITIKN